MSHTVNTPTRPDRTRLEHSTHQTLREPLYAPPAPSPAQLGAQGGEETTRTIETPTSGSQRSERVAGLAPGTRIVKPRKALCFGSSP